MQCGCASRHRSAHANHFIDGVRRSKAEKNLHFVLLLYLECVTRTFFFFFNNFQFCDSTGRAFLKGVAAVPGEVAEAMNMQSREVAWPRFQSCASSVEVRTGGRGPVREGALCACPQPGLACGLCLFSSAARLSPACLQRVAEPARLRSPVPPGHRTAQLSSLLTHL